VDQRKKKKKEKMMTKKDCLCFDLLGRWFVLLRDRFYRVLSAVSRGFSLGFRFFCGIELPQKSTRDDQDLGERFVSGPSFGDQTRKKLQERVQERERSNRTKGVDHKGEKPFRDCFEILQRERAEGMVLAVVSKWIPSLFPTLFEPLPPVLPLKVTGQTGSKIQRN